MTVDTSRLARAEFDSGKHFDIELLGATALQRAYSAHFADVANAGLYEHVRFYRRTSHVAQGGAWEPAKAEGDVRIDSIFNFFFLIFFLFFEGNDELNVRREKFNLKSENEMLAAITAAVAASSSTADPNEAYRARPLLPARAVYTLSFVEGIDGSTASTEFCVALAHNVRRRKARYQCRGAPHFLIF